MHFVVLLATESALEQGDRGATAQQGQLSRATLPTQPSPPVWETNPMMDRLGNSTLEVIGADSAPPPQGKFGAAASSQAPCLDLELLVKLFNSITNFKCHLSRRSLWGQRVQLSSTFSALSRSSHSPGCSKLQFNAHYQVRGC